MEDLRAKQEEMQASIDAVQEGRSADVMIRQSETERRREWRREDRQEIADLASRVDAFKEALGKSGSSGSWVPIVEESAGKSEESPAKPEEKFETEEIEQSQVVSEVIQRMQRKAEMPQAVFLEALRAWKDIPEKGWSSNFPPGYRTRISAEFLSEVYSSGATAEKWSRGFIAQRSATKSHTIKEMISVMMAIDTMILVDREPGVINRIALERLCRKALGIVESWRQVECEADWSKPAAAPKSWKTKVRYEEAKQFDPYMVDDSVFRIRKLEEEVRGEVVRGANLLKARNKLEKQTGGE